MSKKINQYNDIKLSKQEIRQLKFEEYTGFHFSYKYIINVIIFILLISLTLTGYNWWKTKNDELIQTSPLTTYYTTDLNNTYKDTAISDLTRMAPDNLNYIFEYEDLSKYSLPEDITPDLKNLYVMNNTTSELLNLGYVEDQNALLNSYFTTYEDFSQNITNYTKNNNLIIFINTNELNKVSHYLNYLIQYNSDNNINTIFVLHNNENLKNPANEKETVNLPDPITVMYATPETKEGEIELQSYVDFAYKPFEVNTDYCEEKTDTIQSALARYEKFLKDSELYSIDIVSTSIKIPAPDCSLDVNLFNSETKEVYDPIPTDKEYQDEITKNYYDNKLKESSETTSETTSEIASETVNNITINNNKETSEVTSED